MLDALPFAIYAINATGFITYCNDTAVALWGRTPPLSGKKRWSGAWRLYHQDGSPLQHEDCAAARALRAGEGTGNEHDRNDDTTALHLTAIVQNSDDAIISKDLNGIIQSWNNGAQRIFGYSAEEIVGKSILTIVPHERHGEEDYILRHLRNGERIDHFETVRRHKDGTLIDISLTVSPVRNAHGIVVGASKIARDITDRKNAEKRLQRQALHLAALNRAAIIISRDLDLGRIVHAVTSIATELSQAEFGAFYQTVFVGGRETYRLAALSDGDHNNLDETALAQNQAAFEAVFNSARAIAVDDTRNIAGPAISTLHFTTPVGSWPVVSALAVPVLSSSGAVLGGLFLGHSQTAMFSDDVLALTGAVAAQAATAIDNAHLHKASQMEIAQRRRAEEAKELLVNEIKHRVKNTLGTVQAIASQTLRNAPQEERDNFIARLHALSAANDILTQGNWAPVALEHLMRRALSVFDDPDNIRIRPTGPPLSITARKALLIAMAIHELGTNATKHGALSNDSGHVAITWDRVQREDKTCLLLCWQETGGPPLSTPPAHTGFGTRMIVRAMRGESGDARFDFKPDGLVCTMEMAL